MSKLQQQAVQLISGLSDDNLSFLIEIIRRIMPQEPYRAVMTDATEDAGRQAFMRLEAARTEIKQYLPEDFDEEYELNAARSERYGDFN